MGVVTLLIHLCRVIISRMVKPYCRQSSVTFSGLSSIDILRSFLDEYCYLASSFVPLCFPQYCAVKRGAAAASSGRPKRGFRAFFSCVKTHDI